MGKKDTDKLTLWSGPGYVLTRWCPRVNIQHSQLLTPDCELTRTTVVTLKQLWVLRRRARLSLWSLHPRQPLVCVCVLKHQLSLKNMSEIIRQTLMLEVWTDADEELGQWITFMLKLFNEEKVPWVKVFPNGNVRPEARGCYIRITDVNGCCCFRFMTAKTTQRTSWERSQGPPCWDWPWSPLPTISGWSSTATQSTPGKGSNWCIQVSAHGHRLVCVTDFIITGLPWLTGEYSWSLWVSDNGIFCFACLTCSERANAGRSEWISGWWHARSAFQMFKD